MGAGKVHIVSFAAASGAHWNGTWTATHLWIPRTQTRTIVHGFH